MVLGPNRRAVRLLLLLGSVAALSWPAPAAQATQPITITFVTETSHTSEVECTPGFEPYCWGTQSYLGSALSMNPLGTWQLSATLSGGVQRCFNAFSGTWSLTAANGDSLTGQVWDHSICGFPRGLELSVTGGSGAFAGYTAPRLRYSNFPDLICTLTSGTPLPLQYGCVPGSVGEITFNLTPPA